MSKIRFFRTVNFSVVLIFSLFLLLFFSCDTVFSTDISGSWWGVAEQDGEKATIYLDVNSDGNYSWKEYSASGELKQDLTGTWSTQINKQEEGASYSLNMQPVSEDEAVIEKYTQNLIFTITNGGNNLETFQLNEDSTYFPVYFFHRADGRSGGVQ